MSGTLTCIEIDDTTENTNQTVIPIRVEKTSRTKEELDEKRSNYFIRDPLQITGTETYRRNRDHESHYGLCRHFDLEGDNGEQDVEGG